MGLLLDLLSGMIQLDPAGVLPSQMAAVGAAAESLGPTDLPSARVSQTCRNTGGASSVL